MIEDLDRRRADLIKAVLALGSNDREWAEAKAVIAVRNREDKHSMDEARIAVARHDANQALADKVIQLIWTYFPDSHE